MQFLTVKEKNIFEFTVKKSRFIGICLPVVSEAVAMENIAAVRKEYKNATHVVYAFSVGENADIQRSSDDGEPSGTAGRPVLECVKNAGLNNVLVLVVRYFGGILLGTGGLVRAYTMAASSVLQGVSIVNEISACSALVSVPYASLAPLMKYCESGDFEITDKSFGEKVSLSILISKELRADFECWLANLEGAAFYILDENAVIRCQRDHV